MAINASSTIATSKVTVQTNMPTGPGTPFRSATAEQTVHHFPADTVDTLQLVPGETVAVMGPTTQAEKPDNESIVFHNGASLVEKNGHLTRTSPDGKQVSFEGSIETFPRGLIVQFGDWKQEIEDNGEYYFEYRNPDKSPNILSAHFSP